METKKIKELLGILAESQEDTAPIELSIGYVSEDNQVQHGSVVIKDCPERTIEVLNKHKEFRTSMIRGGLLVEVW